MIDRSAVKRLTLIAAALSTLAVILALAVWRSISLAGGIGLGFALGMAPFVSWTWIVSHGLQTWRRRALAVVLLVGKLGVYAAALYVLVTRAVVSPLGVMAGITVVIFTFTIGALAMGSHAEAKS